MNKLKGKIALVTGSSRGIGRSIALHLAQAGALVVVHYSKRKEEAESVVDKIKQDGGSAFAISADLSTFNGINKLYSMMDQSLQKYIGDTTFDILVNNAGIGQILTLEESTEGSFNEVMNINVKASFFIIQKALPRLKDGGRIINISSFVTRVATPSVFAYSISKWAINTLTHTLAQQLDARGITVNAILPGIINTKMNAETLGNRDGQKYAAGLSTFNRWGEPNDIADIVGFLSSSDSRWITGELIDAIGGSCL
ncbi:MULTISPECIES: SDR family NAD(P)-dependent oxidoreductase [Bacillus cereus group]|uniref:SDR family NAD(P)-dependent oxidoreductase n=1 Tax=Bacillus cereus group TaxID=86661 RepID=UPI0001A2089C|nr:MULTISPECIES: SDR family NAD(P)-dependent oxidoreductase [Bacillus cereus group]EEM80531.1 Short chain dehydrogenase [Bacillus thuringiensis serovar huazhongensis BGSC 4BD1]MDA2331378.1 SDR family oxidoreductase [Bacillus cereus]MDA2337251.1 SDR family oxidoreductase [Bacillus cereus]MDA2358915.1 SDR family oxidoreductase [Bacillus cereus]